MNVNSSSESEMKFDRVRNGALNQQSLVRAFVGKEKQHFIKQVTSDPFQHTYQRSMSERTDSLSTMSVETDHSTERQSLSTSDEASVSTKTGTSSISEEDLEEGFDSSSIFRDVPDSPEWALKEAAEAIDVSQKLLRAVAFDPQKVFLLREELKIQQQAIESLLAEGPESLEPEMIVRLSEQRDHLIVKEKMLSQYLQRNPFSEKNVLYPRRIYAEAARLIFEKKKHSQAVTTRFFEWYNAEVASYEQTDPERLSRFPAFYLNKKASSNPFVKYNAQRIVSVLESLAREEGVSINIIAKEVEEAVGVAMNQRLDWEKTEQHLLFSMGEKTGAYVQVSTPLSKSETAVGENLRKQGIGGIIPSVRDDGRAPINTRLTQLFKIENGEKILLHERQQHGINDHFAIKDVYQRQRANVSSMKQLVQSGAEADPAFIRDAIEHPNQPHHLFYINTNLTTPTWTPRGSKNNELTYSYYQGKAMEAVAKEKIFDVLDPDDSSKHAHVNLDVTCIDFRFPVNYAISDVSEDFKALDPGMVFVWPVLEEHNAREFQKLFGRLHEYAPIEGLLGPTYQKLCVQARVDADPDSEAAKLQHEIEEQVLYIREMFQTQAYQRAEQDRFKMPRHIDLLVNAFRRASQLVDAHQVRVVNAGGCMSGKDREGVANAENEAAVIIQDLGRSIEPGQGGRSDKETQAIYDACMTGVVNNTRQVARIGGSKNAQEIVNQMSDPDAKIYAQGGSSFVSA